MGFHNDNADIVFLACLQNAASGGALDGVFDRNVQD